MFVCVEGFSMYGFICMGLYPRVYSCTHTGREGEGNQLSRDMDRKEERI